MPYLDLGLSDHECPAKRIKDEQPETTGSTIRKCAIGFALFLVSGALVTFILAAIFFSPLEDSRLFRRSLDESEAPEHLNSTTGETFPYNNIRIPKDIFPSRYKIHLHPNLSTFEFDGSVDIEMTVEKATKRIILHTKDLTISEIKLLDKDFEPVEIKKHLENVKHQQLYLEVDKELEKGKEFLLRMKFNGTLNNKMIGFYRSGYRSDDGRTSYMATTQFEATNARMAFPCFDEPEFKAIFTIIMTRDKWHTSLSNMPLKKTVARDDGYFNDHYQPSVKMSTYLVAFVVSDFKYTAGNTKKGIKVRVWARENAVNDTKLALSVATDVIDYYESFFNIPYPLPKMDLIAVPDFAMGAMENWGLVTFRENALLNNPRISSATDKQWVAIVVAHEIAHMWFGNLVTMKWWDEIWLNEGFANYIEYLGTNHFAKDWKVLDQFVGDTLQTALAADSYVTTHPIAVPVKDPAEINEIFDQISYDKGSSVVKMLHDFLGEENFKKGLEMYLKANSYGNAESNDLWAAFSKVSHLDIKKIMDSWIYQKGYPVITVKTKEQIKRSTDRTVVLSQQRYFADVSTLNHDEEEKSKNEKWIVPFSYITQESPDKQKMVWMNGSTAFLEVPPETKWIKANVGQTGFYRVNYDQANWDNIIEQLNTDHTVLGALDRSGLISDAFSFAKSGLLPMTTALKITQYLGKERDYVPWKTAIDSLGYIGGMLSLRASYDDYEKYMVKILKPIEKYVGWQNKGELLKMYLRTKILSSLCTHGDESSVKLAKSIYSKWMQNEKKVSVSPHIRLLVYHTAIKFGGEKEFNFLWNRYLDSTDATEKGKILYSLSASKEPKLLARLLESTLQEAHIRPQDTIFVIGMVSSHSTGTLLAWEFVQENFDKIVKIVGSDSIDITYLIKRVTGGFNTQTQLESVQYFIKKHNKVLSQFRATKQALEKIQMNINWMKKHGAAAEKFLKDAAQSA